MAIVPGLQLRQTHNLVMTPQLRLAIRILQMTGAELSALVEEELQGNPLLTAEEPDMPDEKREEDAPALPGTEADSGWVETALLADAGDAPLDTDYVTQAAAGGFDDGYTCEGTPRLHGQQGGSDGEFPQVAATVPLLERLGEQLRLAGDLTPQQRLIGAALIARLDPVGRLDCAPEQLADLLGVACADVEAMRHLMMGFEPVGLFACSLQECLRVQLVAQNRFDPAMEVLLDHLDLVAERKFSRLRALCGVDEDDFGDMLVELRRLDPKPGFDAVMPAVSIVPDVVLRRRPEGGWRVEINEDAMPGLWVDRAVEARVLARGGREECGFVRSQLAHATWLMKALEQRARSLLQVASAILRHQNDFLDEGVVGLHPLTLREIAEETGLHESTVSRITSGKYIATPRGVFELKYFFTSGLRNSNGGENHSSEAVRSKIRHMIDTETAACVLSDDEIVQRLRKEGIDIARRTVAKYRDALQIANSVQRKREKAASA